MQAIEGPLSVHRETVHADWIDYNGHMNVAYYVLAFDHATDAFLDQIGMGQRYLAETHCSVFTAEAHVTYEQEVKLGDPLRFETLVLGADAKRIHYFHRMYHDEQGYLAATNELLILHVDMQARRVVPMPESVRARVDALLASHAALERPPQVGRVIGLTAKKP
jgi:acyl-CoA thioester hydrolase